MRPLQTVSVATVWTLLVRSSAGFPAYYSTVDWASLRCPENDSSAVLPTPTYGLAGAVFTVCTEQNISAPPELVYNTILDFRSYHLWNSFVVDVEDLPPNVTRTPENVYVGMPMTFVTQGIVPLINTTSSEIITVLGGPSSSQDAGGYLFPVWRDNLTALGVLVQAEHPNVLVDIGGGLTRYVSYETYYQEIFVGALLLIRETLQERFVRQGEDLRRYVEGMAL